MFVKYHVTLLVLFASFVQHVFVMAAPSPYATVNPDSDPSGDMLAESANCDANVGLTPDKTITVEIYFRPSSLRLSGDGIATLRRAMETLKDLVARSEDAVLLISGYAGGRGSSEYTLGLAAVRCERVRQYLVAHGIPESRLRSVSFGFEEVSIPEKSSKLVRPQSDLVQISMAKGSLR